MRKSEFDIDYEFAFLPEFVFLITATRFPHSDKSFRNNLGIRFFSELRVSTAEVRARTGNPRGTEETVIFSPCEAIQLRAIARAIAT